METDVGPAQAASANADAQHQPDMGWMAGTWAGRVVLSVILAFLAITLVIWNLPDSEIRSELRPGFRPIVNTVAIDQSWSVFAPNPTTISLAVEADVYLRDGTVERYKFPHGDDFIGAYREYRWRKWERRVRLDSNDHLWKPTAIWVASRFEEHEVQKVVLVRNFSDTPEPGGSEQRVWTSVEFFTLELSPDGAAS